MKKATEGIILWLHKNKPPEQDQLNSMLTKRTSLPYAGNVEKETKQLPILCVNANTWLTDTMQKMVPR